MPSKALAHLDRINLLAQGTLPPPVTVEIDLADGFCNHACPHCFFSTSVKKDPIFFPINRAASLANELQAAGVRAIEFPGGGEPTTHPKFEDIVRAFSSAALPMGLVTNGQLYRKVARVISYFEWVRISVDAGSSEDYRQSHGVDRFEQILRAVSQLADAGNAAGTQVGVGYVVTPSNWKSTHKCVELMDNFGLSYIQFRPAAKVDWKNGEQEQAWLHLQKLKKDSFSTKIVFSTHKWSRIAKGRDFPTCETSSLVGIVKANGTVPFCCLKRDVPQEFIGSVLESSFQDVWFNKQHLKTFSGVDHTPCPLPCKHDSYNEVYFAARAGTSNLNFL